MRPMSARTVAAGSGAQPHQITAIRQLAGEGQKIARITRLSRPTVYRALDHVDAAKSITRAGPLPGVARPIVCALHKLGAFFFADFTRGTDLSSWRLIASGGNDGRRASPAP
jgi:hypothetical protein